MEENRRIPRKLLFIPVIVIVAILVIFGVLYALHNKSFDSYNITAERTQDDTLSYSYCAFAGNVLQYGADGAMLLSDSETVLWEASYNMSLPKVAIGSDYGVIYDRNGLSMQVFNEDEVLDVFSVDVPIVKASVSEKGTVAAIEDDGSNTWIKYYKSNGEEIAEILTKINQQGYPMDVAVSPDGEILAVPYLLYSGGVQVSNMCFYSFDEAGDNQTDNIVSQTEYSEDIIPDVEYIDSDTVLAFADKGFIIFEGNQRPEQKKQITVKDDIVSVFHNKQYIGLMLENDSEINPYTMKLYKMDGEEMLSQDISFVYDEVEIVDDQISLYLREKFCVYNITGKKRFEGSYEGTPQEFFAVNSKDYITVTDEGIHWIQLK